MRQSLQKKDVPVKASYHRRLIFDFAASNQAVLIILWEARRGEAASWMVANT